MLGKRVAAVLAVLALASCSVPMVGARELDARGGRRLHQADVPPPPPPPPPPPMGGGGGDIAFLPNLTIFDVLAPLIIRDSLPLPGSPDPDTVIRTYFVNLTVDSSEPTFDPTQIQNILRLNATDGEIGQGTSAPAPNGTNILDLQFMKVVVTLTNLSTRWKEVAFSTWTASMTPATLETNPSPQSFTFQFAVARDLNSLDACLQPTPALPVACRAGTGILSSGTGTPVVTEGQVVAGKELTDTNGQTIIAGGVSAVPEGIKVFPTGVPGLAGDVIHIGFTSLSNAAATFMANFQFLFTPL